MSKFSPTFNTSLRLVLVGLTAAACTAQTAANVASAVLNANSTGPRKLTDEDAFIYARKDGTGAPVTNVSAIMTLVDGDAARRTKRTPRSGSSSKEVGDVMDKITQPRLTADEDKFQKPDKEQLVGATSATPACATKLDDATLNSLKDEYLIPNLEKIPVRDQGGRGTCAAFAGVGALEYAAINSDAKGSNSFLETLDLSEQHFYWLAKPKCQQNGCQSPFKEGSSYDTGYDQCMKTDTLSVPLEVDCPYHSKPANNDTQVPQAESCNKGALRVAGVGKWCGVSQLIEWLNKGYAVPYASPLSDNWEHNDGMITKADMVAAGKTVHAGGHAYLIVGYKRLPDMPEEGGLCFVIKNSWGIGWGVHGYACMTVAWMNAVTFDGFLTMSQPIPTELLLRDDLQHADTPPDDGVTDDDGKNDDVPNQDDEVIPDDEYVDDLPPEAPEDDLDPDAPADRAKRGQRRVPPKPAKDEFQPIRLVGPGEAYFRAITAPAKDELLVALETLDGKRTGAARVVRKGDDLLYQGDKVGRVNGKDMSLCTAEFAALCSLRLRKADNQLYLQFRDDDLRAVAATDVAADKGEWTDLKSLGLPLSAFVPKQWNAADFLLDPKLFVKMTGTEPARLSLRPTAANLSNGKFDLRLHGIAVGAVDVAKPSESSLCSGKSARQCQIFAGTDRILVVPSNTRGKR